MMLKTHDSAKTLAMVSTCSLLLSGCNPQASSSNDEHLFEKDEFREYWYSGVAELNSYDLDQSRYGENRKGNAMLIFVTEGFSKNKQVKLDDPEAAGNDKVSVLKLNYTKNFVTGIYPYSMMLSAFTPVSLNQFPNTMKVSMSSQEWCGHVYTQVNLRGTRYQVDSYSYFEREGDSRFSIEIGLLEDELFNLLRLDPEHFPTGKLKITPGLFFTRLKHENLKAQEAVVSKKATEDKQVFTIVFPDRQLSIDIEKDFPYKILGWEEKFTERGQVFVTRATLTKTLITDYWRKNKTEFNYLRDTLGFSPNNF
jgi:hypothetical protein